MASTVSLDPGIKFSMMVSPEPTQEDLLFAAELGVSHVFTWFTTEQATIKKLKILQKKVKSAGLTVFNVGHRTLGKCNKMHLALDNRDKAIK